MTVDKKELIATKITDFTTIKLKLDSKHTNLKKDPLSPTEEIKRLIH